MKTILATLFSLMSFFAISQTNDQFRLVGSGTWSTINDSTYQASLSFMSDLSGGGFLATDIVDSFRLFTGVEKIYRVDTVWNKTFSSASVRVVEYNGTSGIPSGQVMVYNPDGRSTIPQVPFGSTGATAQLQAAVVTYNAKQTATGSTISDGDKGDIDITSSAMVYTIDTSAVTSSKILDATVGWVDLAQAVKDSIDAVGGNGIDTLATYTALRAYAGSANVVILNSANSGGLFRRVATGTENGGTIIIATNGVKWGRVFDGVTFSPAWWEVGGFNHSGTASGIVNDRDRLNSCVQTAGGGATIQLEKNYTYIIDIEIVVPYKNMRFDMNGATLKRFVTPITTLTATEGIGSTMLDVVSTTGFRVGHRVFITDVSAPNGGVAYNENCGSASSHIVTSVVGNTIGISPALLVGMSSGDSVFVISSMLSNAATFANLGTLVIENGKFDGNKKWNQHTYDWTVNVTHALGSKASDNIVFNNCIFEDIPTENIFGCSASFNGCTFNNLMGSIYHQSRANLIAFDTITKQRVVFLNCDADSICMGNNALQSHSEAAFTFSAKTRLYEIVGGRYTNISGMIFSGFDGDGEFGIRVNDAYFENALGVFTGTISSTDTTAWNVNFSNSHFINVGDIIFTGRALQTGKSLYRVNFVNNTFVNVRILFTNLAQSKIIGNNFYTETPFAAGTEWAFTGWVSALTSQNSMLQFQIFTDLTFVNNNVYAPQTYSALIHTGVQFGINGFALTSDTKYYSSIGLQANHNTVHGFGHGMGFMIYGNSLGVGQDANTRAVIGWDMNDNTIVSTTNAAVSNIACCLTVPAGARASGNTLFNLINNSSAYGLAAYGVTDDATAKKDSIPGSIVTNNFVHSVSTRGILIGGSIYQRNNIICTNNWTTALNNQSVSSIVPLVDAVATDDVWGVNMIFPGTLGTITSSTKKVPPYKRWKQSVGYQNNN